MKTRPILFSTDMVRAILDGRKTMTLRVIRPQPRGRLCYIMGGSNPGKWHYPPPGAEKSWGSDFILPEGLTEAEVSQLWTPPCHTDDVLWVRETWRRSAAHDPSSNGYVYKATEIQIPWYADKASWRPSVHMPKEAARIWLRVTNVRVERLQEITMEDIAATGAVPSCRMCSYNLRFNEHEILCSKGIAKAAECDLENMFLDVGFQALWNNTIRPANLACCGWAANPWVWVITFEHCNGPTQRRPA